MEFNLIISLAAIYTTTIVILIIARYFYFNNVDEETIWIGRVLYDSVALLHIGTSFYLFATTSSISHYMGLACGFLYFLGLLFFLWGLRTSTKLKFASSSLGEELVTTGPYKYIRHPLYLSYTLIWIANCILFNSLVLWITLIAMAAFYTVSAKREEAAISKSEYSREYEAYKNSVGMFLPRVTKWKNSNSKL